MNGIRLSKSSQKLGRVPFFLLLGANNNMEKVVNILLVEDDNLDIIDVKRTLDKMNILNNMVVAKNGEEALNLLAAQERSSDARPDIALIDINMPKMNGLEFLSTVRKTEQW